MDGIILPGWMERDEAVRFLTKDCTFDPPITDADAERIWKDYRSRAEALPERKAKAPPRLPLTKDEKDHTNRFLAFVHARGAKDIKEVIKVNPFEVVARQYYVVTERAQDYRQKCSNERQWLNHCLPTSLQDVPISINFSQQGLDSSADIDIPHAECFLGLTPQGALQTNQALRHVTALEVGGRLLLWAGYHRSFARMLCITPTAKEQSAFMALTSNTLLPPPTKSAGVTVNGADAGLNLFGVRPALLADFFTDGLFMRVNLRKKRYQLQVRSRWVAIDVP